MNVFCLLCILHNNNFDNTIEFANEIRAILEEYDCLTDDNLPEWFVEMLRMVSLKVEGRIAIHYCGIEKDSNATSIPLELKHRLGWEVERVDECYRLRFPRSRIEVLIQYEGDICKIRKKHGEYWANWMEWASL